jgi:DNA-binding winged helix-turn-helix (wHTH) protein
MSEHSDPRATIEFGRFRVLRQRRELLVDGIPLELGGRAFDVLIALIDAGGSVLSKDELMSHVWPDRVVEENNLQVQIAALRKALAGDRDLVRTVAGRGYQFTGEILAAAASAPLGSSPPATNLTSSVSELIGRDVEFVEVVDLVKAHRLVTLTGAGGIGKTRLSLEVGRKLLSGFTGGVWVAELGPLSDPALVPVTVAAALGLSLAARAGGGGARRQADPVDPRQLRARDRGGGAHG